MPITRDKFIVILEPEEDGGYSVHCPALPGCVSQGDTRQAALENIKEAIQLVLETLEEDEEVVKARVLERVVEGTVLPPYGDTPDLIAEEIRQILKERHQDGLSYAGVSFEEVELPAKAPA
jgi:predicted RNase H-like HicB family nuclease